MFNLITRLKYNCVIFYRNISPDTMKASKKKIRSPLDLITRTLMENKEKEQIELESKLITVG